MSYGSEDGADDFNGLNDWAEFQQRYANNHVAERTTIRAAIYCRRSIADPSDTSIGRQLEACTDHCRAQGFVYDTDHLLFVDVDRSGATLDGREGLHAALAAGDRGEFEVLVFEKVDRLTRDVLDAHRIRTKLKPRNVLMHAAGVGEVKLVPLTLRAFHAEKERKRTTELLMDGRLKAAAAGLHLGRKRIFGYVSLPTERSWAINEHEASVLREIFRSIDEDDTRLGTVIGRLEAQGVAHATGKRWYRSSLYLSNGCGLLQNTLLKGVWRFAVRRPRPVEIALPHLAIVEADLFDRVNAKLDRRAAATKPRAAPRRYLLSGILRCAVCDGPMTDFSVRESYRRIHCRAALDGRCTESATIKTSAVERQLLLTIKDDLLHEDRRSEWNSRRERVRQELEDSLAPARALLQAELHTVDGRLEDLRRSANDLSQLMRLAMADDELTHHRLVHALDDLALPALIAISDKEAGELSSEISELLRRLPIAPETDENLRLFARLRTLIPQLTLARKKDDGDFWMRFRVGVVDGREPKVHDVGPGIGLSIERTIPYPGREAPMYPEKISAWHEAAAEGAYELSDEDWSAISHLFKPFRLKNAERRLLAEALLMLAATGMPRSRLPERYAHARYRIPQLRRFGIWPEMLGILRRNHSLLVDGLSPRRFDCNPR